MSVTVSGPNHKVFFYLSRLSHPLPKKKDKLFSAINTEYNYMLSSILLRYQFVAYIVDLSCSPSSSVMPSLCRSSRSEAEGSFFRLGLK